MRINLYLLLLILFFSCANAQKTVRQKSDAYVIHVVRLYNTSAWDSLYRMGGTYFQKSWPTAERFREIFNGIQAGYGNISSYQFDKIVDSSVYYKANFRKEPMNLFLTINKAGNLVDFGLSSGSDEPPPQVEMLAEPVSNPLN